MLTVGGVISTGVSLTKKAWRLHVVAGMNALFGAREDLDVKFVPNQERLSSLVDSAMNFASTSMIMSNFHYHVLYPRSRK